MTDEEKVRAFLFALAAITKEHGIAIDGNWDPPSLSTMENATSEVNIASALNFDYDTGEYGVYIGDVWVTSRKEKHINMS